MFERQSVLAAVLDSGGRNGSDGFRRLRLGELTGWQLIQLSCFSTMLSNLSAAVSPVLGAHLPTRVGEVRTAGNRTLLKTRLDQFWIFTRDDDDLAPVLGSVVTPSLGSISLLSHSRACIFIKGPAVRELLALGVALDLHPTAFAIGQFALTGLHHTPVLIHREGESHYNLFVMRTFALTVWDWISDAALRFGYECDRSYGSPTTLASVEAGPGTRGELSI